MSWDKWKTAYEDHIGESSVFSFFPTLLKSVYFEEFPLHRESIISRCLEIYDRFPEQNTEWRCNTYSSLDTYSLKDDNTFKPLIEKIRQEVLVFSKEYGVESEELTTVDAWVNIAGKDSYQEYHIHTDSHFSAVFYIKVPDEAGNLVFRSFEADTDMFSLPVKTYTKANYKTMSIPAEEGKLLIFRSNLKHMVERNLSNDLRISLSLNFRFNDSDKK